MSSEGPHDQHPITAIQLCLDERVAEDVRDRFGVAVCVLQVRPLELIRGGKRSPACVPLLFGGRHLQKKLRPMPGSVPPVAWTAQQTTEASSAVGSLNKTHSQSAEVSSLSRRGRGVTRSSMRAGRINLKWTKIVATPEAVAAVRRTRRNEPRVHETSDPEVTAACRGAARNNRAADAAPDNLIRRALPVAPSIPRQALGSQEPLEWPPSPQPVRSPGRRGEPRCRRRH